MTSVDVIKKRLNLLCHAIPNKDQKLQAIALDREPLINRKKARTSETSSSERYESREMSDPYKNFRCKKDKHNNERKTMKFEKAIEKYVRKKIKLENTKKHLKPNKKEISMKVSTKDSPKKAKASRISKRMTRSNCKSKRGLRLLN